MSIYAQTPDGLLSISPQDKGYRRVEWIEDKEIIDKSASDSDLHDRNEIAKEALRKLIEEAGRRIHGDANNDTGRGDEEG
jgi:hypothetical protein